MLKRDFPVVCGLAAATATLLTTQAANPKLGGPMRHLLVSQTGNALNVCYESSPFSGLCGSPTGDLLLQRYEERYAPPADVLDGQFYNAQYGWLPDGFFNLPSGSGIFIELVSKTAGLEVYDAFSFEPRFGTAGSLAFWSWDGVMTHHWHASATCGHYEATYRVYIGGADSAAWPGYQPAEITLTWAALTQPVVPDFDTDGDVDLEDFGHFQVCLTGPDLGPPTAECLNADLDADCDVDQSDFGLFQRCISGPEHPVEPDCLAG
jgi:hypothetical protein